MRLTPLDIKKQEFTRALRGLDAEEVQAFLNMMALQWEELLAEHRRSEDKVRELQGKLGHYQRVEEALQEALQTARENAKQALKNAEQKADLVRKEAEAEAREVKHEAQRERDRLQREVEQLQSRRDEIVARLRAFLHSEVELLARYDDSVPAEVRDLRSASPVVPPSTEVKVPAVEEAETTKENAELDAGPDDLDFDVFDQTTQEAEEIAIPEADLPAGDDMDEEILGKGNIEPELDFEIIGDDESVDPVAVQSPTEDDEALSFRFFEPMDEDDFVVPASPRERRRSPERGPARPGGEAAEGTDATWIVRPVVSVPRGEEPDSSAESVVASNEEIEKIRRILSDLD